MTNGPAAVEADPDLLVRLREALAGGPPLRLAVLYGSAARGALREDSDVDVGIIPGDPELPLSAELDLQTRLATAAGREAEVVRLDRSTTLLRWQAVRDGILLVGHPPAEWTRFRARAAVEHAELRVVRDPAAERFRARLALGAMEEHRQA